jgi:ADP-ribose pyrophosphatase
VSHPADGGQAGRPAAPALTDLLRPRPVVASTVSHHAMIWDVVKEKVDLGEAGVVEREYVRHTGAVCVLALDDADRVLLLRQYRHPVRRELWEPPAGLLDIHGEDPLRTAQRELAEEADLVAGRWAVLLDWYTSPGGMDEALRCYLARDLVEVPAGERHAREAEELGRPRRREGRRAGRADPQPGGRGGHPGGLGGPGAGVEHPAPGGRAVAGAPATALNAPEFVCQPIPPTPRKWGGGIP